MPPVKSDILTQELIKNIDLTNDLVRELIADFHAGEVDFAKLSTELNHLISQFKELSTSLNQTDELILSINLKIALLEKTVSELESWSKEQRKREQDQLMYNQTTDRRGRWQLLAGALGIIGSIISLVFNYLNK